MENRPARSLAPLFLLVLLMAGSAAPARAYLDPGSGSYMLQILLAGALAAGVVFRRFWARLFRPFRRARGRTKGHD